jgi:hypothetical protein
MRTGTAFADLVEWLTDYPYGWHQVKGENAMLPSTVERVPEHTNQAINEQIRRETEVNVARYQNASH